MPTAHLYLFSDACPTDWLVDGQDETWHTIVNFAFQSAPELWPDIERGRPHDEVLDRDPLYSQFLSRMRSASLPSGQLRKWRTGPGYQERFCQSFIAALEEQKPLIAACSFQERTIRQSKYALIHSYNRHIGGIEGRGIGFEEYADEKGRLRMKHSFLNFQGHHEIDGLERQMLILLFMAWFVADQFRCYHRDIVQSGLYGFDNLQITVVSDKLSGDGDDTFRRKSEQNLRHLIDPEGDGAFVRLTRSIQSDTFSGDLIADNIAGWLTASIADPASNLANYAKQLIPSGVWAGWYNLIPSHEELKGVPAVRRLVEQ